MNMHEWLLSSMRIALCIFLSTISLFAGPRTALGLWSWDQTNFNSRSASEKLIHFCKKEQITRVDQHLSVKKKNGKYILENKEGLKRFIASAHKSNIQVNGLRGEKDMFYKQFYERTLNELAAIIEFNQSQPKHARFDGIKYDVEPYSTDKWKEGGAARQEVMLDYLNCLVKIRAMLDKSKSKMKLYTDVPFWWDEPEHSVSFRGKKQVMTHHIQDLTDGISIMSYRRDAHKVLKISKSELAYANKIGKKNSVSVGLETSKIDGPDKVISFHGQPIRDVRKVIKGLQSSLKNNPASWGIMIHQYRSYRNHLDN